MEEIWKDVVGYEGYYQVSNFGRIKSVDRIKHYSNRKASFLKGRVMSSSKNACGYERLDIRKDNVKKQFLLHRLIAEAFIPNTDNKPEVNHINGIKDDNRVCNLEWVTHDENMKHAYNMGVGTARRGSDNGLSKLAEIDVYNIKYNLHFVNTPHLTKIYSVSKSTIEKVRSNRSWTHI
jgi:hypothetical protein